MGKSELNATAAGQAFDKSAFLELYPFRSNYLDIGGLAYHYLDEGAGDPIVMIHGNPTWSFYYRRLVAALSPTYRTIVPDHIGCGLSDKPPAAEYGYRLEHRIDDLGKLLDALGITDKLTLILHDWGGMIGMAYAVQHPERVSRLILMNTAAYLPPGHRKLPFRLRLIRNLRPIAVPAVLGLNLFSICSVYMATHRGLSPKVKAGLKAPYNSWRNRIAVLKFVQDIPLRPGDPSYRLVRDVDSRLHCLTHLPIMICWGHHDFVFDPVYFSEWQHRFPDAESHLLAESGHYVLEDEPEKVTQLTIDFLKRHPV